MKCEDTRFDLLVVGSGAGGLSAAITARLHGLDVLVVEKDGLFGGTTAVSGGWLWIPCNPHSRNDSVEAARTYLAHESGRLFDAARVDAFLEHGPRMVEFFERQTQVRLFPGSQPDYHPNAPGGVPGGRTIGPLPFDGRQLGKEIERLRPPLAELTFGGMMVPSSKELAHFFNATRSIRSAAYVASHLATFARDKALYGRPMRLTNGNALVARLARSAFDLGIPIRTASPAQALILENGVRGAVVAGTRIEARRGVILATGGFSQDLARRGKLFPHAQHRSPTVDSVAGDGVRLGEGAGGEFVADLPNAAAWTPVSVVPRHDGTTALFPHFRDRTKPGVIAVNRRGRRFANEANSYHDFVQAMSDGEAWLIADHRTVRRYGLGYVKPFPLPLGPHLRSGYLIHGATLAELAQKAGIDAAQLVHTIAQFNPGARRGVDPEFGRGSSAYNYLHGDPGHKPNPCLAPVERAPFYAIRLVPGDIGTFAGLRTDENARVLTREGRAIAGLYAVGNDAASIMGGNYPGSGITLGPAMTFGYIAARHAAGR